MLLLRALLAAMGALAVGVFLLLALGSFDIHLATGSVEDVLAHNETLERNKTYDAIFASLFTYDHNENMLQAFHENWRPSTNTVSTFIGEFNIFGDDVFGEDCVTSPNPPSVLKGPNLSLDNAMTQATNKDRSTKLSENIESFQNFLTTDIVAEANNNRPSNVPKDLVQPLHRIALNFEPQKSILAFKLSYISGL
ncbi:hypothetical protein BC332_01891 [Capsicum chinense]|nr:hypothetical protein BC332_01891 [Capsicum chinense]